MEKKRLTKPNTGDMVLYCTFAKDCEDMGLVAPPFTRFIQNPDYYEAWYLKAVEAAIQYDVPPSWLSDAMGWDDDGA